VNLAALPPRGATLFVGALKLVDGSGTPARVLALVG
jgi:kynurenine formamidase